MRRNGPRIVASRSLFFWIEKKKWEGILNGYLLRSVDRANGRSGFNNEKVNNVLYMLCMTGSNKTGRGRARRAKNCDIRRELRAIAGSPSSAISGGIIAPASRREVSGENFTRLPRRRLSSRVFPTFFEARFEVAS